MDTKGHKYIKYINYRSLTLWDVKRYMDDNIPFDNSVKLRELLHPHIEPVSKEEMFDNNWQIISKINFSGNLFLRGVNEAKTFKGNLNKVDGDTLIYSKINARHGCIYYHSKGRTPFGVSSEYPAFKIDSTKVLGEYLVMVLRSDFFKDILNKKVTGISKARLKSDEFLDTEIPLLTLSQQKVLVSAYKKKIKEAEDLVLKAEQAEQAIKSYLFKVLEIDKEHRDDKIIGKSVLKFVKFKTLKMWGYDKLIGNNNPLLQSQAYPNKRLGDILEVNPTTTFLKLSSDAEISFIPMECVSGEYGVLKEKRRCKIMFSKGYTKFQNGDLIWARITPCMQNGKSAIVDELINGYGCGSTEFHVLRNHNKQLSLEYIHILLRQSIILTDAMNYFTGSAGQQRVPKSYLENLSVPIPPFQIQNAIVAHIKESKKQVKVLRQKAKDLRVAALIEFENKIFE